MITPNAEARTTPTSSTRASLLTTQTWVLPTATLVFLAYLAFVIVGRLFAHLPFVVVLLPILPSFLLTWFALAVALTDIVSRPSFTTAAKIRWAAIIALFNVLAFLPYWLFVVRPGRK